MRLITMRQFGAILGLILSCSAVMGFILDTRYAKTSDVELKYAKATDVTAVMSEVKDSSSEILSRLDNLHTDVIVIKMKIGIDPYASQRPTPNPPK